MAARAELGDDSRPRRGHDRNVQRLRPVLEGQLRGDLVTRVQRGSYFVGHRATVAVAVASPCRCATRSRTAVDARRVHWASSMSAGIVGLLIVLWLGS
jgi:hypothetical protein